MSAAYHEIIIRADAPTQEILAALLEAEGCEGFVHEDDRLLAYAPAYDADAVSAMLAAFPEARLESAAPAPDRNWNAEWEASFTGATVDTLCQILPPHAKAAPGFRETVWILPEMAFGTGTHETTRLVARKLFALDLADRKTLDWGCGSGVLGILAAKLGAGPVDFLDFDPKSTANTQYNLELNRLSRNEPTAREIVTGGIDAAPDDDYGLVLGNINREVLLSEDGALAARKLASGGELLASGFFDFDSSRIISFFNRQGLELLGTETDHNWMLHHYRKNK